MHSNNNSPENDNCIHIYTDGACSQNPGPGGWAAVLLFKGKERRISGFEPQTTNNRMELLAVIKGLEALKQPSQVIVYTDSQYVQHGFTKGWLDQWVKKGWKTAKGDPVKNKDLWSELLLLRRKHHITWTWVKGHSGNTYNEICDELARNAIILKDGVDLRMN